MNQEKYFPIIDYTQHPGFTQFSPMPRLEIDDAIESHFANIDAILHSVELVKKITDYELDQICNQQVKNELDKIYSLSSNEIIDIPGLTSLLREALIETNLSLRKDLLFLRSGKTFKSRATESEKGERVMLDIKKDGVHSCNLPSQAIDRINSLSEVFQKELFARRTGRMDCTGVLDISGEFGKLLLSSLAEVGVIDGISGYLGHQVEPMYCGLQLSHQDDDWWTNCYADAGIPTSKTVYMHLDQDVMIPKTVIYLSVVNIENGPFRLIKGSHLWKRSTSQTMFYKILDTKWRMIITEEDFKNAPPNYYRKRMCSLKGRRYFGSLPYSLRGTSHFGDDILDGSEVSKRLLEEETAFLSEKANCITFIGGSAIHRGSQVEQGHRINLQIAWVPKPSLLKRFVRGGKRTAYKFLKRASQFKMK